MSRTNETRHIEPESCKCECRLNASVSNNKNCNNKGGMRINSNVSPNN